MKKIPTIARSALLPPSTLILQTLNTARSAQLPNSSFRHPTSRMIPPSAILLNNILPRRRRPLPNSSFILPTSKIISKIRFQPVDSLPPACALPSAPSLLISKTKLQHKIPDAKNQPFIIRKNLLTNHPFLLKKTKRYVCALQRIFIRFIYISFAEWKQLFVLQSTFSVPYRTVLQYYSITVTVYHFGIAIESLLYI